MAVRIRRDVIMKGISAATMHTLPEHALPHLVHLLAHRPQFGEDGDYKFEAGICNFTLNALTHTAENYPFLDQLIRFMKGTQDAEKETSDVRFQVHLPS